MAGFEIPEGWTVQAFRFAFNHMLGVVKANLDQRAAERSCGIAERDLTPAQGWSLPKLRKTWNQIKGEVAPWWQANSNEPYNTGLEMDVEPSRRPAPPPLRARWGRQEATNRQPRTPLTRVRGPLLREEKPPEMPSVIQALTFRVTVTT